MSTLITGSSGFLGRSIKNTLGNNSLIELSRTSGDYICSLDKEIPRFKEKFDLVIHSAGKAHSVPKSEKEKKEFNEVNVIGTKNLLQGLKLSGLPLYFIFISSVSVYGISSGSLVNESTPLLAKDPYGASKIDAEKIVEIWCKENNVVCTILRLPLLIGKDAPGNFGAMLSAIRKGYYININDGKAKKSMTLAEDVAKIIPIVAPIGGTYNLTDGIHPSFKELSIVISERLNKRVPKNIPYTLAKLIALFGDLLGSFSPLNSSKLTKMVSDLTFDDSKARSTLGWNPKSVLTYLNENLI